MGIRLDLLDPVDLHTQDEEKVDGSSSVSNVGGSELDDDFQSVDKDFVGQEITVLTNSPTDDAVSDPEMQIPDVFTTVKVKVSARHPPAEGEPRYSQTYGKFPVYARYRTIFII